MKSAQQ